ncbi:PREDICTED: uncharacterized protein LOC106330316 [Brassica oleracea var. oleracea]|uniref:uncharacterized protein LOC106330316 n=1 Tax=Brassica oleracea var. oleracea TaxID=109376 RepID=UPI0006A73C80|nr:PREDICTED: uncharacterized protein LOC106330316 [Brassica oleracea var. oleracea]
MVSDLLTRETRECNTDLVEKLMPELKEHVLKLRPSVLGKHDAYIWPLQQSRSYSVKSGYYSTFLSPNQSTERTRGDNNEGKWKKLIWSRHLPPKLKFFLWKIGSNALPSGENLRKRGMLQNITCNHCGEPESVDHILFHCQYANEVWRYGGMDRTIDTTDATTFFEKLERSWNLTPLPPYGFTGNALPWICWAIWTSRNQRIFENRSQSPEETALKAIHALKEWEIAQPPSLKIPKSLTTGQQHDPMVLDPSEIFCNTDASWSHTSKETGLAWIFTNGSATEIFCGSIKQSAVSSPCMGEALAIREALLQAATNHYSIICIRTDSQVLAQAITSRRKTTELYGILSYIDELAFSSSSPFINCRFTYISRANNGPADGLAKACLVAQPVVNPNQNSV